MKDKDPEERRPEEGGGGGGQSRGKKDVPHLTNDLYVRESLWKCAYSIQCLPCLTTH